MATFSTVRRVPFTAQEMFDLVADVERYPEFVPYCDGLVIEEREEEGSQQSQLIATMTIAYAPLRERFKTRVSLDRAGQRILVRYLDGPFSHLENRWQFADVPSGTGSDVDFFITYEFRSRMLSLMLGPVMSKAFERFTVVFEERAKRVYGVRTQGGA